MSADSGEGRDRVAAVARTAAWWSVLALIAVVPLLTTNPTILGIGRYPLTVDQVELPRTVVLTVLSWFGLAAWGIAEWREPKGVRRSRLWWVLLAFALLAGLSAVVSRFPQIAYLGRWFRYEGLLTLWTYGAACFVAAQTATKRRLVTLVRAGTVAGAVLATYGLLQAFGLDKANWLTVSWWGNRAFGTWANPDFFGGYLLFPLAFSIAVMTSDASKRWRVVGALSLAVVGVALVMTLTRGAWLAGMLVGGLMLGCLVRRGLSWRRTLVVTVLVFAVAFAAAFVITDGRVVSRALNTFKSGDDGVGGRLDIWRATAPAALDWPALGTGPDTFELAMVSHISEQMPGVPDDPHNAVLYLLITLGVPATLAGLGFVGAVLAQGSRPALWDRGADLSSMPLAAIWSAAVAHGAFLMLSPSITASTAMLFVCLGVLIATGARRTPRPRGLGVGVAIVAVAVLLVSATLGVRGLMADHAYFMARTAAREGGDRIAWATRAVDLNPLNDRYALELERARAGQ